jgi:hypothetical protein
MLLQLINREFKYSYQLFLLSIGIILVVNNLFVLIENSWGPFFRIGLFQLMIVLFLHTIIEKIRNSAILDCSLPTTRNSVIQSQYVYLILLGCSCILILFLDSFLMVNLLKMTPTDHNKFFNFSHLLIYISILILFIGFYLPISLKLDKLWIAFSISIIFMFFPLFSLYQYDNDIQKIYDKLPGNLISIPVLLILLIIIGLSYKISSRIFIKSDI